MFTFRIEADVLSSFIIGGIGNLEFYPEAIAFYVHTAILTKSTEQCPSFHKAKFLLYL